MQDRNVGSIERLLEETVSELSESLPPASSEFLRRVYTGGIEKYRHRLRQYGFEGESSVLDAGCGFGQWSIALSDLSQQVTSMDISDERLRTLSHLRGIVNANNIDIRKGHLASLPFPDNSFSAVFCYGSLFLSPWRNVLKEFRRVLEPNGKLYVNANGLGWYINLWKKQPNATEGYDPRKTVISVLKNTLNYDAGKKTNFKDGVIIEPDDMIHELRFSGFEDVKMDAEGKLRHPSYFGPMAKPFFASEYDGELGVYEVLCS